MLAALVLAFWPAHADIARVENVRLGVSEARTRLVLELSEKVEYRMFFLADPYRLVVDFPALEWPSAAPKGQGVVADLRFGLFTPQRSRLVIDSDKPIAVAQDFTLAPSAGFPHRLVLDLRETTAAKFAALVKRGVPKAPAAKAPPRPKPPPDRKIVTPPPPAPKSRPVVVVDAGHGGVDPGARGRKTHEKNVTLAFSREFAKRLRETGRYKVHLTRSRDVYVPLRKRVDFARDKDADLFISIHADAIARKNVRGLSIYTLSEVASDKEAAALARKENRSDIIAGVDFEGQRADVTDILIDLSQRESKNQSVKFANIVVDHARGATQLLERTHRFAGFRVLKAPDVPSVLVELGFLTNRKDEKQLRSAAWRRKIAARLTAAVDDYFSDVRAAESRR